jgi:hypothetical protein
LFFLAILFALAQKNCKTFHPCTVLCIMNSKANGVWALSLLLFAAGTMFLSKRPTSVVASTEDRRLRERQAIQRSVLLLESSARQWHADCVSCHHHALELITVMPHRCNTSK